MSEYKISRLPSPEEEDYQEGLAVVWALREKGIQAHARVAASLSDVVRPGVLEDLIARGSARIAAGSVLLSETGEQEAKDVIRRNRLAERMLTDVLELPADQVEADACRMEHVLSAGVSDAICTLLGHPEVCPHGTPIPRGKCCEKALGRVESVLRPLDRLREGESGRVAYLISPERPDAQRLLALGLVPGVPLRVDQRSPAVIVTVGENVIAMEAQVARGIFVRM